MIMNQHQNSEDTKLKLDNEVYRHVLTAAPHFSLVYKTTPQNMADFFDNCLPFIRLAIEAADLINPALFFEAYRTFLSQITNGNLIDRLEWFQRHDRERLAEMADKKFNFQIHVEFSSNADSEQVKKQTIFTYEFTRDIVCAQLERFNRYELQMCYVLFCVIMSPENYPKILKRLEWSESPDDSEKIAEQIEREQIIPFVERLKNHFILCSFVDSREVN